MVFKYPLYLILFIFTLNCRGISFFLKNMTKGDVELFISYIPGIPTKKLEIKLTKIQLYKEEEQAVVINNDNFEIYQMLFGGENILFSFKDYQEKFKKEYQGPELKNYKLILKIKDHADEDNMSFVIEPTLENIESNCTIL